MLFTNVSFSGEKEVNCADVHGATFLNVFNSLAQEKIADKKSIADQKSMLLCEAKADNPFAAVLLVENYPIFKVDTGDLYQQLRKHAKEGEPRSLTLLGLSNIDPRLGILDNGEKPDLRRWYAGGPYNYEEAAKFYHEYHYGTENRVSSYRISEAYAYLHYAHLLGSEVAKRYLDKLVLKMSEHDLSQANITMDRKVLINASVVLKKE